jgi:hypothetical protein
VQDTKIAQEKKAITIHGSLSLIGIVLLMLGVLDGWVPQAIIIALCTRVLYGLVVLSRLKEDAT